MSLECIYLFTFAVVEHKAVTFDSCFEGVKTILLVVEVGHSYMNS